MKTYGNRNGFSMVEVLVASAILIVIVMMLAMLFQQTSLSWRTGIKRADSYMQIRSGIGAIQRDASAAVDERTIPAKFRNGKSQTFDGPLRFFTLTGTGFENPKARTDPWRSLRFIEYSISGNTANRTEQGLNAASAWTQVGTATDVANVRVGKKNVSFKSITAKQGQDPKGLPLYVRFEMSVDSSGNSLDIGAGSAGPDKVWNTKDDIKTWVD